MYCDACNDDTITVSWEATLTDAKKPLLSISNSFISGLINVNDTVLFLSSIIQRYHAFTNDNDRRDLAYLCLSYNGDKDDVDSDKLVSALSWEVVNPPDMEHEDGDDIIVDDDDDADANNDDSDDEVDIGSTVLLLWMM